MKLLLLVSLFLSETILASQETIAISELGKLELNFANINVASKRTVNSYTGKVSNLAGSELLITAPFTPQKITYLVAEGSQVNKGQVIAQLEGSEVHHFNDEFDAKRAIFNIASERLNANKELFKNKSISNEKWLSISRDFYQAKLDFGHLKHFSEYFQSTDMPDTGLLLAPATGIILYSRSSQENLNLVGNMILEGDLRVVISVPKKLANKVSAIRISDCTLQVDKKARRSQQLLVQIWTKAIPDRCNLIYGEQLPVWLYINQRHLIIPKESATYLDSISTIFIRDGDVLRVSSIDILGQDNSGNLLIKYKPELAQKQLLITSVSAVQGVIMGLGTEE
ncbi:MAG: hypothetical protein V2I33_15625 [Kangiellaceae bacterium]|jgi:hypothetical protein|nr:hypothetical protein [Kangiellaceae bacterium]